MEKIEVKSQKKVKRSGIVIHSTPYGEAHKIITLFTPDAGMVSAMAHGARKLKNKFRGKIEILSYIEGLFHQSGKSSMLVIEEVQVIDTFAQKIEYDKLWGLFPLLRALYLFHFSSEEENQKIFQMFVKLLKQLEETKDHIISKTLLYAFMIKALIMSSMAQNFRFCCYCGKENLSPVYFNAEKGQFCCCTCRENHYGFQKTNPQLFDSFLKIIYSKFEEIVNLKIENQELVFMKEILQSLFMVIFEKRWDDFEKEGNPFSH